MNGNTRSDWKSNWRSQKRKGLLDAVVSVVARSGIENLTMDNVALEAGVSKGTLYAYFKNKQDLFRAAIDASIAPLVCELKAVLTTGLPPDIRIRNMIQRHLAYFEENRNFFQILIHDRMAAQARLRRYKSDRYQDWLNATSRVIEEGIRHGLFRAADSNKTAAVLIEANIAIINQRLLCETPGPVQDDANLLAETFLFGIAAEGYRKRRAHS